MCKNHFSPIQCILPPYLTDKLVDSENKNLSKIAVNTKFRSFRLRSDREFFKDTSATEQAILCAVAKKPTKVPVLKMEVYSCNRKASTTGATLLWSDTSPKLPTDKDAKNVINAGSGTWKFYYELFGRNSVDNLGLTIQQYVHYDKKYDNAFWDGRRMIFGDGDGTIFGSFTTDIDVIGHELTHGVTQYEANLEYHLQSGALNESFSDVFGILIKQRMLNQDVKKSNWLIGENVLLGNEYALRSMKEPGTGYRNHPELGDDPQPATMDGFVKLPDTSSGDWGGVHYNSGIPNFAFYVAAFNMGGFAWEKAGKIWYTALTDKTNLKKNASFSDMRKLTIKIAGQLYGTKSLEAKAVTDGWNAAKVK
ncbi:M4 family metallopeptidase [Segetibacter aerophilus]|uniref:Neutral metalloproteinase n=1 Tax=Segetibacter aerophilus TaxID=670293 RepID=A0A512BC86_9BACT|nr:M4 family metallopeptidase [Segetibacter aerophilus]GEO09515.1 metalloprotease [Segetibacter aerophilus]